MVSGRVLLKWVLRRSVMPTNNEFLGFVVTADGCEASILVFANRPSAAKKMALVTPWLCDTEWVELRCRREASVDKYADQFGAGAIECNNKAEKKVLRELGWYEIQGPLDECVECGLYEWTGLSESELHHPDDGDPICAGCRESIGTSQ
jgi:hypothetical protein